MGIKRIARIKDHSAQHEAIRKHVYKQIYNKGEKADIASIRDKSRITKSENENYDEIGFFPDHMAAWSDTDIEEYCTAWVAQNDIYSPYDCTGKLFIMYVSWHRNPCGLISYKAHWCLDV